jgi:hypothetical protein
MKKSKLIVAAFVVSLSFISVSSHASINKRPPPAVEIQEEQSFSDWFFGLFDF